MMHDIPVRLQQRQSCAVGRQCVCKEAWYQTASKFGNKQRVASLHVIRPNRILVPSLERILVRPSSPSSNFAFTAFSGKAALTRHFALGALEQDAVMTSVGDLWEEKQKKSFNNND
jgi:hypothetical protein